MKLVSLSVKLWRAGYRAGRGVWWLMCTCLICCCIFFMDVFVGPFITNRHSVYYTLSSLRSEIRLFGTASREELAPVLEMLEASDFVDYYLLESPLPDLSLSPLKHVSTVVPVHMSLYAVQPSDMACDSEYGEPLDGFTYINYTYAMEGTMPDVRGNIYPVGDLALTNQLCIWGDDFFDMLISENDYASLNYRVDRIIYGISPFASFSAVTELNQRLAELLPRSKYHAVMDRNVGVEDRLASVKNSDTGDLGLTAACLLAYYLLLRYALDRRAGSLAVARLVGCKRRQLATALIGEGMLNGLSAFLMVTATYSLYRLLFLRDIGRLILLLWWDALPVLAGMVILGGLMGAVASLRCLRRPVTDVKGGID